MAKTELGSKRIDPETGRKFYDLGKDPIVSPYTGKSYPRSYFESVSSKPDAEEPEEREVDTEEEGAEIVSLEDAEDEAKAGDDIPDIDGDDDVDLGEDDESVFLVTDDEEEDDVTGIVGVGDDEEQ